MAARWRWQGNAVVNSREVPADVTVDGQDWSVEAFEFGINSGDRQNRGAVEK